MCGISGYYGLDDSELIKKMIRKMDNRGPEHKDWAITDFASIANARLSIIDVEGGNQPIWDSTGQYCIVANCEIYNYKELKEKLPNSVQYSTKSDTEVVLHAYVVFGEKFVEHIDGIFAVAILDLTKRKLILARDRLGIKPLYYTTKNNMLFFGSEVKAILEYEEIPRIIDQNAINLMLNLGYVTAGVSMFQDIVQLPPSTILTYQGEVMQTKKYWKLDNSGKKTLDIDHLDNLIDSAITSQLVSERPIGLYLSGGLDSSVVAAYAAKHLDHIQTFTQEFGDVDESNYAAQVSESIGAEHFIMHHNAEMEIDLVKKTIYAMEHPTFGISPTFKLAEFAKSKGDVVMLSGLGGDEVFAGYLQHVRAQKIANLPNLGPLSSLGVSTFEGLNKMNLARYSYAFGNTLSKVKGIKLASPPNRLRDFFQSPPEKVNWNKHIQFNKGQGFFETMESELIYDQLEGNYLKIADRMSMVASIEVRVPLLHTPLLNYGMSLATSEKIHNGITKYPLRRIALEKLGLPANIVKRGEDIKTKSGYGFSAKQFWDQNLRDYVTQRLDQSEIQEKGVFNNSTVQTAIAKADSFAKIRMLWHLATTHDLMDIFQLEAA